MSLTAYGFLLLGSLLGAIGQTMFKLGATGRSAPWDFVNPMILLGLAAYGLGTIFWIYSLSKLPLTVVYPFTALSFVFVYGFGIFFLGESISLRAGIGVGLIVMGLYAILSA